MIAETGQTDRRTRRAEEPRPWVTVVVVAFERYDLLDACLSALRRQDDQAFSVLVIDNTPDETRRPIQSEDHRVRVLIPGRNLGFAGGINHALASIDTPWTATLNPDAMPRTGWLAALRAATGRYPDAGLFGSKQLMAEDPDRLDGFGDAYSIFGIPWRGGYGQPAHLASGDIEVIAPCGAAALYRTDVLRLLGGFDNRFFCYLEDVDLGIRARATGHRAIQIAGAEVIHAGSAITGEFSDFTLYHSYRNRVWLFAKAMPFPLMVAAAPLFVAANLWLLVRTSGLQPLAPRLRGFRDGCMGILPFLWSKGCIRGRARLSTAQAARTFVWNPGLVKRRAIVSLSGPVGRQAGTVNKVVLHD